jgi:hypothetical protein
VGLFRITFCSRRRVGIFLAIIDRATLQLEKKTALSRAWLGAVLWRWKFDTPTLEASALHAVMPAVPKPVGGTSIWLDGFGTSGENRTRLHSQSGHIVAAAKRFSRHRVRWPCRSNAEIAIGMIKCVHARLVDHMLRERRCRYKR